MDPSHAQAMQAVMAASGQDAPSTQHASPGVWAGSQPGGADYGAFSGAMMQPSQQLQQHPSLAAGTAAASALAPTPEASAAAAAAMEAVNAAAAAAAGMTEVAAPSMVAAAAAAGMESNGGAASLQPVQPAKTEQLTYAAIREAAAVNQAADGAADDAMRAVAAAQQTLQLLMNPPQAAAGAQASTAMEDDAGNSTHHPSGRARRTRTSTGYMDGGVMGVGIYGGGRPNKGLRHFSMKVCEKVESKGTTSYNEVADELVAELKDGNMDDGICYDEKNIRRRVYDAINVLMALDIIAKEKKAIIWRGFPTTRSAAQQVQRLQTEQLAAMTEVGRKAQYLADLVEQQRALKHLLDRNSRQPEGSRTGTALHLPFILVQSKPDATVEVQISPDMQDVQFNFFHYPFEIHDDALVLRKMLEHDNMQKLGAGQVPLPDGVAMVVDGQMLPPEQYMQQQQAAMAAAAGQHYPQQQQQQQQQHLPPM